VGIRPVLRDVMAAHRPLDADPDAYVFGTAQGKPQNPSNVRTRVVTKAVERANERLQETGEPPLPPLTPHGLRRTFASLLYAIGETPPVVMAELGHTDPDLALSIYAAAMRRVNGGFRSANGLAGYTPGRIRTFGLCLRRAALYPLSYGRGKNPV
jgi:integrase